MCGARSRKSSRNRTPRGNAVRPAMDGRLHRACRQGARGRLFVNPFDFVACFASVYDPILVCAGRDQYARMFDHRRTARRTNWLLRFFGGQGGTPLPGSRAVCRSAGARCSLLLMKSSVRSPICSCAGSRHFPRNKKAPGPSGRSARSSSTLTFSPIAPVGQPKNFRKQNVPGLAPMGTLGSRCALARRRPLTD